MSALDQDSQDHQLSLETLTYDVFGQLVVQNVTTGNGPSVVTEFAYDLAGNVWADLNGSGQLVMRRLYLDGPNAVFARIDASNNVAWYLTDHLGSVRALTDDMGTVIDLITYDAWGNIASESNAATGVREKWAGLVFDVTTDFFGTRYRESDRH